MHAMMAALNFLYIVTTLLNNCTMLVLVAVTKKCLSCYREELYPTTVTTTTLQCSMDRLHFTGHVLVTIFAVQNYSSSLEPL